MSRLFDFLFFFLKFCSHSNEGQLDVKINDTVKLADTNNPTLEPNRKWIV